MLKAIESYTGGMNSGFSNSPTRLQLSPPVISSPVLSRLQGLLHSIPLHQPDGCLSITLILKDWSLSEAPPLLEGDFYWAHPRKGLRLLGRGCCHRQLAQGSKRWSKLSRYLDRTLDDWRHLDPDNSGCTPKLFAGLAFDDQDPMLDAWQGYPNSGLFLPELLVQQEGEHCHLTFTTRTGVAPEPILQRWQALITQTLTPPGPARTLKLIADADRVDHHPTDTHWLDLARRGIQDVQQKRLQKVVIYRRRHLYRDHPIPARQVADYLERAYPDCRLFAHRQQGRTLVSAAPERLVCKRGRQVWTDALAGTTTRSGDCTEDRRLGQALLQCPKTRHEQQLVVDAIQQALSPLCPDLQVPSTPGLKRLNNVQHLWSEIRGQLEDKQNLLQVAARLFPTPAVCGTPQDRALQWLRRRDQAQRGWYSGAGGWIDRHGDGELDVLLRCALLHGRQAELFAGAGLVAGSDAEAELLETEIKLEAALAALHYAHPDEGV